MLSSDVAQYKSLPNKGYGAHLPGYGRAEKFINLQLNDYLQIYK